MSCAYAMLLHMTNSDLTTNEAADILGESKYTTLRRVKAGELTPVKKLPGVRGAFIFDRADVDDLKFKLTTPADTRPTSEVESAGVSSLSERRAS